MSQGLVDENSSLTVVEPPSVESKKSSCCQVIRDEFSLKNFCFDFDNEKVFYSSQWRLPRLVFVIFRVCLAIYVGTICLMTISYFPHESKWPWPVYLTNWSYVLFACHEVVAATIAVVHVKDSTTGSCCMELHDNENKGNKAEGDVIDYSFTVGRRKSVGRKPGDSLPCYIKLSWLLFSVACPMAVIVAILANKNNATVRNDFMNNMQRNAIVYSAVDPLARAVVQNLIRKGIKLLALDFDLTIVGVHTGGAWRGPIHQLAQHVRPCFKSVIEAALESGVLHVCIVTYSLQQGMIEDLLKYILPNSDTRRILVRTSLKDWLPKKNQPSKQSLGKQQHIAQVTTDLYNFCHAVIHPHEILLMDDDEENINIARHFGHTAFLVKEAVTLEDIYAFVEKLNESCVVAPPAPYVHPPESIFFAGHGSKHELPDHLTISSQKQRPSASVYLTSSPHSQVPTQRQSVAVSSSFAIPRPMVANETVRRTMPGEARARTEYGSAQPNSAATYIVMTNSR